MFGFERARVLARLINSNLDGTELEIEHENSGQEEFNSHDNIGLLEEGDSSDFQSQQPLSRSSKENISVTVG